MAQIVFGENMYSFLTYFYQYLKLYYLNWHRQELLEVLKFWLILAVLKISMLQMDDICFGKSILRALKKVEWFYIFEKIMLWYISNKMHRWEIVFFRESLSNRKRNHSHEMVQIYLRYYFDVNFFFVLFLKARDIIFHEIDNFILFYFESEIRNTIRNFFKYYTWRLKN